MPVRSSSPSPSSSQASSSQASSSQASPSQASSSQTSSSQTGRQFWLDGDAVMCACPDCHAPMFVRPWLLLAQCWRCATWIELSEEDEQAVQQLLEPLAPPVAAPAAPPAVAPPQSPPDELAGNAPRQRRRRRNLLETTPAWLISFLLHLLLLVILGLLTVGEDAEGPLITLSLTVDRHVREGEQRMRLPADEPEFDLPLPDSVDPRDPQQRRRLMEAAQDARELRVDPRTAALELPDLQQVQRALQQPDAARRSLASRDPRLRAELVQREGGTTLTEASVARGLRWLARHQNSDGSWSLDQFDHDPGCTCSGRGILTSDSAATSLSLLPFLGAGQTHLSGHYQATVARGLRWLLEHQRGDGDLRADSRGNAGMYAHGQGTIVLCEAFLMTGDETFRVPAQKAVDFIVDAQHPRGGWRYRPGQEGDTSVLGWQLMALQSARAARLTVPDAVLDAAESFLDSVARRDGARYAYTPRQAPTHVMTAEALLCRIYLGWGQDRPQLQQGVDWLLQAHAPSHRSPDIYYWYYATQTLHHVGGDRWERWNLQMRDVLVNMQETRGHEAGSWAPRGPHANAGGRIYMTALAVCTLEVYYRHLPIFRQIPLD